MGQPISRGRLFWASRPLEHFLFGSFQAYRISTGVPGLGRAPFMTLDQPATLGPPILDRWTLAEADLFTGLSALFASKAFETPGGRLTASFDPLDTGPAPAPPVTARLVCGPGTALLGLTSWNLAALHPAATGLDPERLPPALRLALLDSLFRPLLEALSKALGAEAALAEVGEISWQVSGRVLKFRILLEGPAGKIHETAVAALADGEAGRWLLSRLSSRPRPRRADLGFAEVPVAFVVGGVCLQAAEVASLAPGDLIIADDPPIREDRAFLERPWPPWIALALEPGQAVVTDLKSTDGGPLEIGQTEIGQKRISPKEAKVDEKLSAPKGPDPSKAGVKESLSPPPDLELPLRFEIGRRLMSLRELEALAPGAVLPLENDPQRPLTVTCHGKPLARGLLVDLGDGRLGAQLTEVGAAGASQADISQADITQAKPAPKHA